MFSTPWRGWSNRPYVHADDEVLGFELEPPSERTAHHGRRQIFVAPWLKHRPRRRCIWPSLISLTALVTLIFFFPALRFWRSALFLKIIWPKTLPPLYASFRMQEAALPQHNVVDPFADGRKYLWIAGHTWGFGWGNVMQEMVLNAYLTYTTGRAYVFDDYIWDKNGPEYSFYGSKLIPSRIPLSAIVSGPVAGERFPDGDTTPPAISRQYWEKICPHPTIIQGEVVRVLHGPGASALKIVETWRKYLADIKDPCVEVSRESKNIFHVFMFGHKDDILPIWPTLRRSPILTSWGWSDLVQSALKNNRALLSPVPPTQLQVADNDPYAPIPGLLAIHVRRGDFSEHCPFLASWGAAFNAFNSFPEFLDLWSGPQGTEEQRTAVYLRRCYPTIEQIVEKVEAVRRTPSGDGLRNIYIMTNGERGWLEELKDALRRAYDWEHITTSRDMVWTPEQKYVSQATDMLIGQRAQVLIGNGFSSMTSNIAMLRMVNGLPPNSTRMW